jgi:acetolactate synthase-1/2/3 large subunit
MEIQSASYTKSDLIAAFFVENEVPAVFELSGGMIAFLTDAIARLAKTPIINMRHEQAAGFAAEGATRVTGRSAVAMGTSGPGATNLITAIASSYFDSVPTIFITGQVNQKELKKSENQRQNGFQELDIIHAVKGITKYAVLFDSKSDVLGELKKAWSIANSGRPGPVLLDIPIDVQQEIVAHEEISTYRSFSQFNEMVDNQNIEGLATLIGKSKRPIFLLGGGIRTSQMTELTRKIIEKWKLPVVYSLMGVDAVDSASTYRIGMIGSYGNRWANRTIDRSDLIIALGTRLDIRQTGADTAAFTKNKKIFRVDVDKFEIDGRVSADFSVETSLQIFLTEMSKLDVTFDYSAWLAEIYAEKASFPQRLEQSENITFNPSDIMEWISSLSSKSMGYVVDVGQHQMWAAQSLVIESDQRFMTSGGLGAMGFALPAAVGAAVATTGRWIVIAGDGCSQLSSAEFQTLVHYNLPITLCIINNGQHGMVAQFQETNLDGRYISTREGYSSPEFTKIASAFGIKSLRFQNMDELEKAHKFVSAWDLGPLVLEFMVSPEAKALPKMGMGTSIQDL